MRHTSLLFLSAQILDGITTAIGLCFGLVELNPLGWGVLIPLKIVATLGIVAVLQFKKPSRLDWLVVIAAGLPVVWNLINLVLL